jgi:hypothetical protein
MTKTILRRFRGVRVATFAGVLLVPFAAHAATFRIDLPGLRGDYDAPGDRREAVYDLGQRLSTIESIGFELELGDADSGGMCTLSIPGYCTPGTQFTIVLRGADGASLQLIGPGFLRPNSLNEFRYTGGGILDPVLGFILDPLPEFLLGGHGSITFELRGFPRSEGGSLDFYRGEIRSATFVVNGTPVPSASTAGSILLGLAMLSRRRRIGRA